MALPSSGEISIADLKTEFGSTANNLGAYYRGGGIVPDIAANSGVPTSGSISLADFYGAQAGSGWDGDFTGDDYFGPQSAVGYAFASIFLSTNGNVYTDGSTSGVTLAGSWDGSIADSTNTECRFVVTGSSGDTSTNASTWSPLTVNRSYDCNSVGTGPGNRGFVGGTIEIREVGTTSPVVVANFSITATAT